MKQECREKKKKNEKGIEEGIEVPDNLTRPSRTKPAPGNAN